MAANSSAYHDEFGAARTATAHMLEKGRRAPGFLGATMLDKARRPARRAVVGCRTAGRWPVRAPAGQRGTVQHGVRYQHMRSSFGT